MSQPPDRIRQFEADLEQLRICDPAVSRDRLAVRLGLVGMAAGIGLPVAAYFISRGTTNALGQRDAIVLALIGVACAIAGGALYLKGSLAGFFRFWLVRDLHERRAQTDRVVSRLSGGDRTPESELT